MVPYLSPRVQGIISALFNVSHILAKILLFRKNLHADGEPGINALLRAGPQIGPEPVTYFLAQVQTHAGRTVVFPAVFSCKTLLENPWQILRRDAATIILNADSP